MGACYRHPDRETGVACSNCGRSICPDCMTATPVGMRCPECSRDRTKVRTVGSIGTEPMLTYALIGVSVLLALASMLSGGSPANFSGSSLNAVGEVARPSVSMGEVWRVLTSGFLHGNLMHLLFNMLALYILGGLLEPAIGRLRFALVYFVSLLAGSFGALLLTPVEGTVGASGAIFGLMGAAFIVMRKRGINPMESGLGLWLLLNLAITFMFPSVISVGGHLGGLAGGALAALLLFEVGDRLRARGPRSSSARLPRLMPPALVMVLGALVVTGSIAISAS